MRKCPLCDRQAKDGADYCSVCQEGLDEFKAQDKIDEINEAKHAQ